MVLSVLAAVLTEAGMQRMMKREVTVCDGTAALTGLLLAMVLPVGAPWWAVIIGSAVAIILGKQLFGGLGAGPFNPVIIGWVVLRLSWPDAVEHFYETTPLFEGWSRLFTVDTRNCPGPAPLRRPGRRHGLLQRLLS
jgi:electron transport complex protein RnfD